MTEYAKSAIREIIWMLAIVIPIAVYIAYERDPCTTKANFEVGNELLGASGTYCSKRQQRGLF